VNSGNGNNNNGEDDEDNAEDRPARLERFDKGEENIYTALDKVSE
jgi:hypothetical protein